MKVYSCHGWKFPPVTDSAANTYVPGTELQRSATSGCTCPTSVDSNGFARIQTSRVAAGTGYPMVYTNMKTKFPSSNTINLFVGFRIKNTTGVYPNIVYGFINDGIANSLTVFANSDLPSLAVNTEYYCEYQLDAVNSIINRWVNGVALTSVTLPSWIITNLASVTTALYEEWGHYALQTFTANTVAEWCIKDHIYYAFELGEQQYPLGPMIVQELPVLTDTGSGFTPDVNGNTVAQSIGTSYATSASLTTPVINGSTGTGVLATKFDASALATYAKCRGLNMQAYMTSVTAPIGFHQDSVTVNGLQSTPIKTSFTRQEQYNNPSVWNALTPSARQPNGQRWDKPSLTSLQYNLATLAA